MKRFVLALSFAIAIGMCLLCRTDAVREARRKPVDPKIAEMLSKMRFENKITGARLRTSTGADLDPFPAVKEFIFKRSMLYDNLQVLFIGQHPEVEFYDKDSNLEATVDLRTFGTVEEIEQMFAQRGLVQRDAEIGV